MLTWKEGDRFEIGGATFQMLGPDGMPRVGPDLPGLTDFFIAKPRVLVERHVELIERLRPKRILELGVFQGGSTAFLAALARPQRLVAVDHRLPRTRGLHDFVSRIGLTGAVRIYGDVDQADRKRLREVAETDFPDSHLDLVIDDCSHEYEATRESFSELFPRLREGGVYLIEDWGWAHTALGTEPSEGLFPDRLPLTRLVFELVLAMPAVPGLIEQVTVDPRVVVVTRGPSRQAARGFDISACSNQRGRRLLAPADRQTISSA
jgi:SAM-dependent methyltransferase